jgi:hypothetical protein
MNRPETMTLQLLRLLRKQWVTPLDNLILC